MSSFHFIDNKAQIDTYLCEKRRLQKTHGFKGMPSIVMKPDTVGGFKQGEER